MLNRILFKYFNDHPFTNRSTHSLQSVALQLGYRRKPQGDSLVEEGTDAGPGILLHAFGQLQDELHDDGLVGHLLHQCFFLQEAKRMHAATILGMKN